MQTRPGFFTSALKPSEPALASTLAFWQAYLKNVPTLQLHQEFRLYPDSSLNPSFIIPATTIQEIQALAIQFNTNIPTVLTAVFYLTLYRYSWQSDILISIEDQTSNTALLRCELDSHLSFAELLKKVIENFTKTNSNKIPFAVLQEQKILPAQLFNIILSFNQLERKATDYFTLALNEQRDQSYHCSLFFNTALFQAPFAERFLQHFSLLLAGVSRQPQLSLLDIPFLLQEERKELEQAHNTAPPPGAITITDYIHDFFSKRAQQTPNDTAITFYQTEDHIERITYQELDKRSTELATLIIQMGVGPGVTTGVCINRSIDLFIAMLAVFKAGGVVVPLETSAAPTLNLKIMDTRVNIVLVDNDTRQLFKDSSPSLFPFNIQDKRIIRQQLTALRPTFIKPKLQPEDLAYIIYTSGTTGTPKGVMITHKSLTNLINALLDKGVKGKVLCTAPSTFDCFFFEWIQGMLSELVIIGPNRLSEQVMQRVIKENEITHLTLLPAVLAHLDPTSLPSVQDVITMGAPPHPETIKAWLAAGKVIRNEWGPTECTIAATKHACEEGMPLTRIGIPIRNTVINILDPIEGRAECTVGIPGEMYVQGPLARGYVGSTSATQERFPHKLFSASTYTFIPLDQKSPALEIRSKRKRECNDALTKKIAIASEHARKPDTTEVRMYKTGDLAVRYPDGSLIFLGRKDRQIKIHGIRLELDGLEAVLRSHPAIKDAAVLVGQDQILIAYIVPHQEGITLPLEEMNQFLGQSHLPPVARLQAAFFMEKFPLTLNGKVDTKALPQPTLNRDYEINLAGCQSPIEKLQLIWSKILRLKVGSFSNNQTFGELGGDSLNLLQLETELNKVFHLTFNPQLLTPNITINLIHSQIQSDRPAVAPSSAFDNSLVLFQFPKPPAPSTQQLLSRSDQLLI